MPANVPMVASGWKWLPKADTAAKSSSSWKAVNALPAVLADATTLPLPTTDRKAGDGYVSRAWPTQRTPVEVIGNENAVPEWERRR